MFAERVGAVRGAVDIRPAVTEKSVGGCSGGGWDQTQAVGSAVALVGVTAKIGSDRIEVQPSGERITAGQYGVISQGAQTAKGVRRHAELERQVLSCRLMADR